MPSRFVIILSQLANYDIFETDFQINEIKF